MNLQYDFFKLMEKDISAFIKNENLHAFENHLSFIPYASRYAFEINLKNHTGADFHVNIKRGENLKRIAAFYRRPVFTNDKHWKSIAGFMEQWTNNHSNYKDHIEGIFLEYDYTVKGSLLKAPSLFIKLDTKTFGKANALSFLKSILIDLKGDIFFIKTEAFLQTLFTGDKSSAYIGYFGLMFSRADHILRLNAYGISFEEIDNYISLIRWKGNHTLLKTLFSKLKSLTDDVIVSYDLLDGKVTERLGLEVFIKNPSHDNMQWMELIDFCKPWIKEHRLLDFVHASWNKSFHPFNSDDFPLTPILDSLKLGDGSVPIIQQKISHLKFVVTHAAEPDLKLYLVCNSFTKISHE